MRSVSNSFVCLVLISKVHLAFLQFMVTTFCQKSCTLALAMNRSNLHVHILILNCMVSKSFFGFAFRPDLFIPVCFSSFFLAISMIQRLMLIGKCFDTGIILSNMFWCFCLGTRENIPVVL